MPLRERSRRRSVVPIAATVTALGALALAAPPAQAADIDVPCDPAALVQAVAAAGASTAADTLSLAPNCVYTLTSPADVSSGTGLPAINGKLTINGNHATIGRAQDAPPFRIIDNWGELTLDKVTITGGHAPDGAGTNSYGDGTGGGSGGGIRNWGPLTITDSIVTGNTSGAGAPDGGTVTGNAAGEPGAGYLPLPASGGGIDTLSAHVTLANGAVVSGNRPDNCYSVTDVPGCVNDVRAARTAGTDRRAHDVAARDAASAMSGK